MIPDEVKAAFEDTLFTGRYNLLLGSGITFDSADSQGEPLPSSDKLRLELCDIMGAPNTTSLQRISSLLNEQQKLKCLTTRFNDCTPGSSLQYLPHYIWRNLFTFNIDDVLEGVYAGTEDKKQSLTSINFTDNFQTAKNKSELLSIHLHGWVKRPEAGYVFSTSEYVRIMKGLNPWMHILSEILPSDPFIIAGTSLNEVDLEYYLRNRTSDTPRRGRGPSLLIEPKPDVVTIAECKKYGLILVPGTFGEFLEWLHTEFPSPPDIFELVVPDTSRMFSTAPKPGELIEFFSDFELVQPLDLPLPSFPAKFMYGREPDWRDLDQHQDIERQDNTKLINKVKHAMTSNLTDPGKVFIILDEAGTGKTTTMKRVGHDIALAGNIVLNICTTSRINTKVAKECLKLISTNVLLLVDGVADHAEEIAELIEEPEVTSKIIVLGSERSYRLEHLSVVFGEIQFKSERMISLTDEECKQLLERYRRFGLVGESKAIRHPNEFARALLGDPVAVAICRIMNDFKPIDRIIESLWSASKPADSQLYLCVALSEHCYRLGIPYSLLQSIAGAKEPISRLFNTTLPLNLTESTVDDKYIIAANSIIAEQVLKRAVLKETSSLFSAFESTAKALAPHVNRLAIMRQTPEARLSGRLFDYDKIVKPLLRNSANQFYVSIQNDWEWNSRYWEQRALLTAETDIQTAIQYARHAVAIELHPFTLTTLAKLLLLEMVNPEKLISSYSEASTKLIQAIVIEHARSRIDVHPFYVLLDGTASYIELGGKLTQEQNKSIDNYATKALTLFSGDPLIKAAISRLKNSNK